MNLISDLFILIYSGGGGREVHETFKGGDASYICFGTSGLFPMVCKVSFECLALRFGILRVHIKEDIISPGYSTRHFRIGDNYC
jgi:hypothetical protein